MISGLFTSPVVALLERELAHERESRSSERAVLLERVNQAEARAAAAEDYARKLSELVLERKAGVRTLTAPPRASTGNTSVPEEGYEPLSDAEARLQAMSLAEKIDYSEGRAKFKIAEAMSR